MKRTVFEVICWWPFISIGTLAPSKVVSMTNFFRRFCRDDWLNCRTINFCTFQRYVGRRFYWLPWRLKRIRYINALLTRNSQTHFQCNVMYTRNFITNLFKNEQKKKRKTSNWCWHAQIQFYGKIYLKFSYKPRNCASCLFLNKQNLSLLKFPLKKKYLVLWPIRESHRLKAGGHNIR